VREPCRPKIRALENRPDPHRFAESRQRETARMLSPPRAWEVADVMGTAWLNGPVGLGAESRVLWPGAKSVLVVVPFVVAGTRLMDVLPLLESDHRVHIVFTVAPAPNGAVCHGAEEFIRIRGGLLIPWWQAVQTQFDVVLAASRTGVEQLHGRIVLMPHGAGSIGTRLRSRGAGADSTPWHGLGRDALTSHGRVLPSALALTHDTELAVLRESCPEALPAAFVAGDICLDRLLASIPYRAQYRAALGVADEHKLVVVSSTWQPESALGRHPDLLDRLLGELSSGGFKVAAILHPNVWHVHGPFHIRMWLADCLRRGLLLLPPDEGWRAALVAADLVIGDYGSVTRYGAAIGTPVLLSAFPRHDIRPGGVAALLDGRAPHLCLDAPLADQVRTSMTCDQTWQCELLELLTSRPRRAGAILRARLYDLLGLPEPARALPRSPVPLPITDAATVPAGGPHD
jgi:hypothetical protein